MDTSTTLDSTFTWIFVVGALLLVITEIVGIVRPEKGDTITEHWRWLDEKLADRDGLRWAYRVFTIGFLVWAMLHFVVGID